MKKSLLPSLIIKKIMIYKIQYHPLLMDIYITVNSSSFYDPIGGFLDTEIHARESRRDFFVNEIDAVLNGEKEEGGCSGDGYAIDVWADKTMVTFLFADKEDGDVFEWIETKKLRKYIFLWYNELHKFNRMYMHPSCTIFDPEYVLYTFLSSVYHKEVDFDQSFTFYIHSESAKALRRVKKQIRHFLASDIPDAEKCAYIKHCADGIHFDAKFIDPLAWLLQRLDLFPKTNNWVEQNVWPIIDWITDECNAIKKFIRNQR